MATVLSRLFHNDKQLVRLSAPRKIQEVVNQPTLACTILSASYIQPRPNAYEVSLKGVK